MSGHNAVAIVLEHVLEHRLILTEKNGAVTHKLSIWALVPAKYQRHLMRPVGTPVADAYDKVVEHFGKIQGNMASSSDRQNLIVVDGRTAVKICAILTAFSR